MVATAKWDCGLCLSGVGMLRMGVGPAAKQKERAHLHGSRLLRIFVAERTFVGGR